MLGRVGRIEADGVAQMHEPIGGETALHEQVPKRLVRVGMVGVEVERTGELCDRLVGLPLSEHCHAEVVVRVGIAWP